MSGPVGEPLGLVSDGELVAPGSKDGSEEDARHSLTLSHVRTVGPSGVESLLNPRPLSRVVRAIHPSPRRASASVLHHGGRRERQRDEHELGLDEDLAVLEFRQGNLLELERLEVKGRGRRRCRSERQNQPKRKQEGTYLVRELSNGLLSDDPLLGGGREGHVESLETGDVKWSEGREEGRGTALAEDAPFYRGSVLLVGPFLWVSKRSRLTH